MSIRLKVIGAIAVVFLLLFAALFISARQLLLTSFIELEHDSVVRDVERVYNSLQEELEEMTATGVDWAYWNDTYAFAQGEDDTYVESNFSAELNALANLDFNFIIITGADGETLFVQTYSSDADDTEMSFLLEGINEYVAYMQQALPLPEEPNTASLSGFYWTQDHLHMVATQKILTSSRRGPAAGTLTFGRIYDTERVQLLAQQLRLNIAMAAVDTFPLTSSYTASVLPLNQEMVAGYQHILDMAGNPVATLVIEETRAIFAQGQQTISILALILLATGAVLSFATFLILDRVVVDPITRLSQEVNAIEETGGHTGRVTVQLNDEVTQVARSVNNMLGRLEQSHLEVTEAYAQATEAARLKGEFLATMSHELRTPLNAIIGYSGIMREGIGGELDDSAMRMVGNIYDSSTHLLTLVNDVLDLSKIEAGHMDIIESPYSLRDLIVHIVDQYKILAREKGLTFLHSIADDIPDRLVGDHERLTQIIINLLSNAIKFTGEGTVSLLVNKRESQIEIAVKDTGEGIPPHALSYIFDEFRQHYNGSGKPKGTGLGLAIVRKLATAMNGTIRVETEMGVGSTFTLSLPLQTVTQSTSPEPEMA